MTKRTIYEEHPESFDWIEECDGLTWEEVFDLFGQHHLSALNVLVTREWDDDYGHHGNTGYIAIARLETDAEEAARELAERKKLERLQREYDEYQKILYKSNRVAIKRAEKDNRELAEYLKAHRNNPRVGDLQNLFMAKQNLEKTPHKSPGPLIDLHNCMEVIEKLSEPVSYGNSFERLSERARVQKRDVKSGKFVKGDV